MWTILTCVSVCDVVIRPAVFNGVCVFACACVCVGFRACMINGSQTLG